MKKITKQTFGTLSDKSPVYAYTIENSHGISLTVITYGGAIQSLRVPAENNQEEQVVCGFQSASEYEKDDGCHGALIGRCANRIGGAHFSLNGIEYSLDVNDRGNHLHGGKNGFGRRLWDAETADGENESSVIFSIFSKDGDMGYPGNVHAKVIYTLSESDRITILYTAHTDADTVINMTNHSYFDLCGVGSGRAMEQYLWIDSKSICNSDSLLIPDGSVADIIGTPFDFTKKKAVGADIDKDFGTLKEYRGYDNNYFLSDSNCAKGELRLAAILSDPVSERSMKVYTDRPCIQLYTANFINPDGARFFGKYAQMPHCGVCLETQAPPDAINRQWRDDVILRAGETYNAVTAFDFGGQQ